VATNVTFHAAAYVRTYVRAGPACAVQQWRCGGIGLLTPSGRSADRLEAARNAMERGTWHTMLRPAFGSAALGLHLHAQREGARSCV
jgi:hypothetical protein